VTTQIKSKHAPGPGRRGIPRALREFPRRPIHFAQELLAQYGDIVQLWIGPERVFLITHPDYLHHVLQANNRNYVKGRVYDAFRPIVGNGLFTSEGDFWRRQRRLANPSFHRDKIRAFVPMFAEQSRALLAGWESPSRSGEPVDMAKEMMRLTFGVVGRALFSADLEKDAAEVGAAFTVAIAESSRRADLMIPIPMWLPTASNRRYKQALSTLDNYVFGVIEQRRKSSDRPPDLLTSLVEAVDDETNESMTDQQLRDEVATFMLAGHETTAVALAWTLYLLAGHTEAQDKVRAECAQVVGDRPPTSDDLEHLTYTHKVLQESMRLYPPLPFIARAATSPDVIGGCPVPVHSTLLLSQYLMHHHPGFWDQPDEFRPERFTPEAIHERPLLAYYPFGGGQRMCIGADFATFEALTFLCAAVQKYRLSQPSSEPAQFLEQLTLRPKGGLPLRVTPVAV
jgi:cytochrome P450